VLVVYSKEASENFTGGCNNNRRQTADKRNRKEKVFLFLRQSFL
jgi:hypothetical protein